MSDTSSALPVDGSQASPATSALIVEDDRAIAMLLRFILEREGFAVRHAADGREAYRMIAAEPPPTVVLLDVMLPYVDGFELIDAVRAQPGWENLPIMMLTSKGAERDIARALDAGANDYMVKPFQPEELKARLRRLLRTKP